MPKFLNVDCGKIEKVLLVHFNFLLLPFLKMSEKEDHYKEWKLASSYKKLGVGVTFLIIGEGG